MSPFAPKHPCSYPGCRTLADSGSSRCERHRIELGHLTPAQKRSYLIADNKIAQNSLWNDEYLRPELTELKESGANLELIGFNPMEIADITLGKDADFKEYDESAADDVQLLTCPECGKSFPK